MTDTAELSDTTPVFRASGTSSVDSRLLHLDDDCRYLNRATGVNEAHLAAFPPSHQNWCGLCGLDEPVAVRGGDADE